jgi:hypothetical protein
VRFIKVEAKDMDDEFAYLIMFSFRKGPRYISVWEELPSHSDGADIAMILRSLADNIDKAGSAGVHRL